MQWEVGVPHCVDPVVEAVQVPSPSEALNRCLRVAKPLSELADRDNPMLPPRQLGESLPAL
jgi:hypothetical protein